MVRMYRFDPESVSMAWKDFSATPAIRTTEHVARLFLCPGSLISAEALKQQLGPESGLVVLQHTWPFWTPAKQVPIPLLWIAPEHDVCIDEREQRASAAYYDAEYVCVPNTNHDVMLEASAHEVADRIHGWLERHVA